MPSNSMAPVCAPPASGSRFTRPAKRRRAAPHALENAVAERRDVGIVRIFAARKGEVQAVDTLRVEARIDLAQLAKAAHQQRRTDDQPQRRGDLADDQQIARARPRERSGVAAREIDDRRREPPRDACERRPDADAQRDQRRARRREHEHRQVQADVLDARHVGRQQRHQQVDRPGARRAGRARRRRRASAAARRSTAPSGGRARRRAPRGPRARAGAPARARPAGWRGWRSQSAALPPTAASRTYSGVRTADTVSPSIGTTSAPMPPFARGCSRSSSAGNDVHLRLRLLHARRPASAARPTGTNSSSG